MLGKFDERLRSIMDQIRIDTLMNRDPFFYITSEEPTWYDERRRLRDDIRCISERDLLRIGPELEDIYASCVQKVKVDKGLPEHKREEMLLTMSEAMSSLGIEQRCREISK